MKYGISQEIRQLNSERSGRKKWTKVVSVLASLVVFFTAYLLMMPGVTMVNDSYYCGIEEHTHTDECYSGDQTLICGIEEGEAHTHTDECYKEEKVLTCTLKETEGHQHTEECFMGEPELICGLEESEEHTHTEECYRNSLSCELEESEGHIHTDECYEVTKVLVCPLNEEPHVHTVSCYSGERQLICTKEEHTHTVSCFADPEADTESSESITKLISSAKLSGDWREDLADAARTQTGYKASIRNYKVAEDGTIMGYTRYGVMKDDPYGVWNVPFVSFCMKWAKVSDEVIPDVPTVTELCEKLADTEWLRTGEGYLPSAGDIIFLDSDLDGIADREAIVTEIKTEEGNEKSTVTYIEGDVRQSDGSSCVAETTLELGDETISGYLNMGEANEYYRETFLKKTYSDDDMDVTVTLENDTEIPKDAQITVKRLTGEEDEKETVETITSEVDNAVSEGDKALTRVAIFEFSVGAEGEEKPLDEPFKVEMEFKTPVFDAEDLNGTELSVLEVTEDGVEDISEAEGTELNIKEQKRMFLSAGAVGPVVLAVSDIQQSGTYYQRVSTIDNINAKYLIVSAEGNYALTGDTTTNYTFTPLEPVKGNPDYYTTPTTVTNAMLWTPSKVTNSGGTCTWRSNGTTRYYLRSNGTNIISTTSTDWTNRYITSRNTWTLGNGNYYIIKSANNNFSRSNSSSSVYRRDMIILKQVNTTLTIPEDSYSDDPLGPGQGSTETRPTYPDYIDTTGIIEGDNVLDASRGYHMAYASDPATSKIEDRFEGVSSEDGKITADKSVTYMTDDYGAFADYEDDEFGVTLSALAQQYEIVNIDEEYTPVDVVLVLDVSGSMLNYVEGRQRADTVVEAANTIIQKIMMYHPENRIGIVTFASGSNDFIPLSRYYSGSRQTPDYQNNTYQYLSYADDTISTASNLRDAYTNNRVSNSVTVYGGTYTQQGIQQGANLFETVTDTTYIAANGEEEIKTPLLIILSDGDPTHCTSNYMNPLQGPHYGSGEANVTTNNTGIQGYYTILTANYFKSKIAKHYNHSSKVYTIGMGIYTNGVGDANEVAVDKNGDEVSPSATGDHYKRTVLNPTPENVAYLSTVRDENGVEAKNRDETSYMLRDLLANNYDEENVTLHATKDYNLDLQVGDTGAVIPVLPNPYSEYSYADGAYFKEDYDPQALISIFDSIILSNMERREYYTSFTEDTDLVFTDTIGEGMEVKEPPVLRYDGNNYYYTRSNTSGNSVSYTYSGIVKSGQYGEDRNLSEITVTVTTDANGTQTVRWNIPGELVPEYVQAKTDTWYYEKLPARLIMKVGLKDSIRASAESGGQNGNTFFTNSRTTPTTVSFVPQENNAYYNSDDWNFNQSAEYKEANPTDSLDTYFEPLREENNTMTFILGNNGMLTFYKQVPLPPGNTTESGDIEVDKRWTGRDGTPIEGLGDVSFELRRQGTRRQSAYTVTVIFVSDADRELARESVSNVAYGADVSFAAATTNATARFNVSNRTLEGVCTLGRVTASYVRAMPAISISDVRSDVTLTLEVSRTVTAANLTGSGSATATVANPVTEQVPDVLLDEITLTRDDGYTFIWEDLPTLYHGDDGYDYRYIYYVVEKEINGFHTEYANNYIPSGTITVTNVSDIVLPSTGDSGELLMFACGIAIIVLASGGLIAVNLKKKRRNR